MSTGAATAPRQAALVAPIRAQTRSLPLLDWVLAVWTALVFLFLFAPLVVVVVFSFNASEISTFPLRGLTLAWYRKLADDTTIRESLGNSLIVAATTVVIATSLGVLLAVGIHRYTVRLRAVVNGLAMLPMMTPRLILGIALLTFYSFAKIDLSLATVIAGHVVIGLPYVVLIVSARLVGFDRSLEEAARDLGAGTWTVFREITLPLLRPAIVGGALIVFTLSFDEVVVSFFTTGTQNTLPMKIWSMLRFGITPSINALAALTLVFSMAIALLAELAIRKTSAARDGRTSRPLNTQEETR
jgi:spermidine/putrescine transport system permease protein